MKGVAPLPSTVGGGEFIPGLEVMEVMGYRSLVNIDPSRAVFPF